MFLMKCLKGRNYAVDKMMSWLSVHPSLGLRPFSQEWDLTPGHKADPFNISDSLL